jgi:ribosomal protein S27AE
MDELTAEQKQAIITALQARGVRLPCPRCGSTNFALLGGYFNQTLQSQLGGLVIGGVSVPSAVTACSQCGFLSQHALGALGLLPAQGQAEVKK